MQKLLPDAIHPKQTGKLPTTDPTIVFHSDYLFILVQTNRYPPHIAAPIAADRGLYEYSPPMPIKPSPMPLQSAYLGFTPWTSGRWLVLTICLSYSTQMYWLRAWLDIESATEYAKRGSAEKGGVQRAYEPTVTMPLRTDSLSLVSYEYRLKDLRNPPDNNFVIDYRSTVIDLDRIYHCFVY